MHKSQKPTFFVKKIEKTFYFICKTILQTSLTKLNLDPILFLNFSPFHNKWITKLIINVFFMLISISIIELDKVVHGFLWFFLVEIEPFACSIRNFQISL
jgi:hypothetical protein